MLCMNSSLGIICILKIVPTSFLQGVTATFDIIFEFLGEISLEKFEDANDPRDLFD